MFKRLAFIIKSKFSRQLDKMEDPGETLDYSYGQMQALVFSMRKSITELVTAKKQMELQKNNLLKQAQKHDDQARTAVRAGRDDLAVAALTRKQALLAQISELDGQINDLELQQQTLIDKQHDLQTKVHLFRTKKEVIKAQYSAAKAQVAIGESANGIGSGFSDTALAMQRAQDKIEAMKARAAAVGELEASGVFGQGLLDSGGDDIDRQLAQISRSSVVDSELEALKSAASKLELPRGNSEVESPTKSQEAIESSSSDG